MLLLASCHSSIDTGTSLSNKPINEVELKTSNETFKVDFGFNDYCKQTFMDLDILSSLFAELKTRDDLINYYKTLLPGFLPGYSNLQPQDSREYLFVKIEYMLAQECFSDNCDSKTRKEVLQLVSNFQKAKYGEYINPICAQKSGVFLMAVILVKERAKSIKFINTATLQQALLCLNSEEGVSEDFSNLITACSEKFLADNKN